MDNDLDTTLNPGEIVPAKTEILARDKYSILMTEAYAMPSSTYVPDDSHTFLVSEDKTMCWANFGRCWEDEGDRTLVAKQKSYKEWLLEFCPPDDYGRCGIKFGLNGVCHTTANRELLIGEDDLSVKEASKNFVTVSIFGKYGFGIDVLKNLVKDSFTRANYKVMMTQDMLEKVLARIDNTMDDEVNAWKQLMETYFDLQISDIISQHEEALNNLKKMINTLFSGREALYQKFLNSQILRTEYQYEIYQLITSTVYNYFDFLVNSNYINSEQYNNVKEKAVKFFKSLFKVLDEQAQTVEKTNKLNSELAVKEMFA